MPTEMPLFTVISQVLQHTPSWVWLVLLVITTLGLRQLRDQVVTGRRLALVPVALGLYSLSGAVSAFGPRAEVVAAWLIGVSLPVVAGLLAPQPDKAQHPGAGRYAVPGSVWPLVMMWSVFAIRYVTTVTVLLHPAWAHDTNFSVAMPLVYGALSGFFLARALRVLRSAPNATTLSLA